MSHHTQTHTGCSGPDMHQGATLKTHTYRHRCNWDSEAESKTHKVSIQSKRVSGGA